MVIQNPQSWLVSNKEAIRKRLRWLINKPNGVLYDNQFPLHRIVIEKRGHFVLLRFVDKDGKDHGAMSEIDIMNPLELTPGYNRLVLFALMWKANPNKMYTVGFGGGRIPLVFHHYFQNLIIDSTDIDPNISRFAERYFGVVFDNRQRLHIKDGRDFLHMLSPNIKYDIILIDAFRGTGYIPYHLTTLEFYELCLKHLTDDGVIAINLIEGDPIYRQRVNTIKAVFKQVYYVVYETGKVAICSNLRPISNSQIIEKAIDFERQFNIPLLSASKYLRPLPEYSDYFDNFGDSGTILKDDYFPPELKKLPLTDPIFRGAGKNDYCPCGMRRKFKDCHGYELFSHQLAE